jgi:hypothetical protein
MPPLADLQHDFARAVLGGEAPAGLMAGHIPPDEAIGIHRDTVFGALANALRLSYPTVEALVGTQFFDRACAIFVQQNLPRIASLAAYGGGFADFLSGFGPAAALAYLADVARLDHAVETALRASLQRRHFVLNGAISLGLPQSLTVLPLAYPAEEIRAELDDDTALAAIDTRPAERFVLVWRKGNEAAVRRVSPAAGCFLASLMAGNGAEAATTAAIARTPQPEALAAIQSEIFAAPFCTLISTVEELAS